ncbi:MAG: hypothetical protein M1833_001664 [Piccolia ochrophora]|nr:MAG: hypothetical protein M1833_001664 [Piccolia ochrophora]
MPTTPPALSSSSLSGKTALITGAGSGINFSLATLLLDANVSVLIADLSLRPEAEALIERYSAPRTLSTPTAAFARTDVTQWRDLEALFEHPLGKYIEDGDGTGSKAGFDIVCPGAGVYEPPWSAFWNPPATGAAPAGEGAGVGSAADGNGPAAQKQLAQSRYTTLDINLTHPIRLTQLAIAHFLKRSPASSASTPPQPLRGTVIHISSIAAQMAPLPVPLYNASKAAISHLVRTLAPLEPELGIRVVAVAPGVIRTPLWTEHPEKLRYVDEGADEWVEAEEVAEVMLGLLDEERRGEGLGGSVWEVGKASVRRVEVMGDEGPGAKKGMTVGKMAEGAGEVIEGLRRDGLGG